MSTLWVAIPNSTTRTRQRAVDALHDAGIEVARAWVDERPTTDAAAVELTRDPVVITLGATMLAGFGALAVWLFILGGWWVVAAVPCAALALFGVTGIAVGAQRKDRSKKEEVSR